MTTEVSCPLCSHSAASGPSTVPGFAGQRIVCKVCGLYDIAHFAQRAGPCEAVREHLYLLSGYIRHQQGQAPRPFTIDRDTWEDEDLFRERIISVSPRTVQEKLDTMLTYLARMSQSPGDSVELDADVDFSLGYCRQPEEFVYYLKHLLETKLLGRVMRAGTWPTAGGQPFFLTVPGWEYVRGLRATNAASGQAFVAMWFSGAMTHTWSNGISFLEADTGFKMVRVDNLQFNGDICDRIVSEIRRSRFLIAEVTGQRPGVYFEAGFAMGLGLPVIWVCREDEITQVHFDARQYHHIVWNDVARLREKLRDRILATVGPGPGLRPQDITGP